MITISFDAGTMGYDVFWWTTPIGAVSYNDLMKYDPQSDAEWLKLIGLTEEQADELHRQANQAQNGGSGGKSSGRAQRTYSVYCTTGFSVLASAGPSFTTLPFVAIEDTCDPLERTGLEVGEIIAYRMWIAEQGYLKSTAMDDLWVPGDHMDGKPSDHNGEGIHAYKSKRDALKHSQGYGKISVVGEIALWGTVIEHEIGYRAEFAKVRSLDLIKPNSKKNRALLDDLRETYGVPGKRTHWPF